jgi:hypothetical protein
MAAVPSGPNWTPPPHYTVKKITLTAYLTMSANSKTACLGISVIWGAVCIGRDRTRVTWKTVAKFKYLETTVRNQIRFMKTLRAD